MSRILTLILATVFWGAAFVGSRWTFEYFTPTWSNAIRFLFAGSICAPFLITHLRVIKNPGVIICSALLALGLQFQTMGIELTTLAKSGFFTVFYAIFTPLISMVIYKKSFRKTYWLLVLFAMFGIVLLCELNIDNFNLGDAYTLLSAFIFSFHILAIEKYSSKFNPFIFNFAQCFVMGGICVPFAYFMEGAPDFAPLLNNLTIGANPFTGFILTSVLSSIVAFSLQVYAQQGLSAHIASLIFLMESVFAALFGYFFFDEILSTIALMGCLILVTSVALIPKVLPLKSQPAL